MGCMTARPAPVSPVAIVPAAGASRRMGEPKLLLPFGPAGETTVIGATLSALLAGGAGRACVVTRPDDEELRRRLRDLPGVVLAVNREPERGMLSSILAGLAALGGPEALRARGEALLVSPADLPALSAGTVAAVIAALEAGAGLAVPVHRRGDSRRSRWKRGHPLGIAPPRIAELPGLDPEVGLRQLVDRAAPGAIVEVPVDDPGCVHDVDTPEDYQRLRVSPEGGSSPRSA
jgi:molybdenum cofactor cytidylyltransferase